MRLPSPVSSRGLPGPPTPSLYSRGPRVSREPGGCLLVLTGLPGRRRCFHASPLRSPQHATHVGASARPVSRPGDHASPVAHTPGSPSLRAVRGGQGDRGRGDLRRPDPWSPGRGRGLPAVPACRAGSPGHPYPRFTLPPFDPFPLTPFAPPRERPREGVPRAPQARRGRLETSVQPTFLSTVQLCG